jgi:hypothetical protein
MSNPCPNNVWNHTDGCACVANGSITAECADVDLTAAAPQITLPDTYEPTSVPVNDQPRHVHDLGDGKVVVTYATEVHYGDVNEVGEKMDAVRGLLVDHSGAEAVLDPSEYSADALAQHMRGEPMIVADRIAFIRIEDGKAVAEQNTGIYAPDHFRDMASRYDAAVVIDSDEMHRHDIPGDAQFRSDFSQVANEINDYTGSTFTVVHDVVDTSTGKVLASDTDDYDGVLTTVDDAAAQTESAHWDVENRLDDFYDPDEDGDDDEFDDWGYGQDLEDEDED